LESKDTIRKRTQRNNKLLPKISIAMNNRCAVAIPIYKETLNEIERINLKISLENLKGNKVYWIHSKELNLDYYKNNFKAIDSKLFPEYYFESIETYSQLIVNPDFYREFKDYSHILICQTDAVVLRPDLQYWIEKEYDYIGAPWPKGWQLKLTTKDVDIDEGITCHAFVGNGGLSLRNIKACIKLIEEFPDIHMTWTKSGHAEDLFFSLVGSISIDFRIPNIRIASLFSHETEPELLYKLNKNIIPFGVHAHQKYPHEKTIEHIKEIMEKMKLK